MALSPGIPTSFVPKQPVQPRAARSMNSGNNIFLTISLVVAGAAVVVAGAVYLYDRYLQHELANKQAQLSAAQANVDQDTVEEFVRLRNRLTSGQDLLANHTELSQFLDTLEARTLQNVRFDTMKLTVAGDHTAKLEMTGTAKNFNALAAQSNAFASEKGIKRAIFSDIGLSEDKLVTFKLTADIDSKLVVDSTASATAPAPVTTTAPAAATSTPNLAPSTAATTTPAAASSTAPRTASTTSPAR